MKAGGGVAPHDFFDWQPDRFDVIVSNPPFSIKDGILQRLYEIGKPFAVLLPMNSLQGMKRYEMFRRGVQLLAFDQRIGFHNMLSMDRTVEVTPFATAYFCRGVLPRSLILEHIEKYDRALKG